MWPGLKKVLNSQLSDIFIWNYLISIIFSTLYWWLKGSWQYFWRQKSGEIKNFLLRRRSWQQAWWEAHPFSQACGLLLSSSAARQLDRFSASLRELLGLLIASGLGKLTSHQLLDELEPAGEREAPINQYGRSFLFVLFCFDHQMSRPANI